MMKYLLTPARVLLLFVLFVLFFLLSSIYPNALEPNKSSLQIQTMAKPIYTAIKVKNNNEYNKEIGKQLKYSILTDEVIDRLPESIKNQK